MDEEELRFTGNWFIDAGILGFVNLMEEVYELGSDSTDTTLDQLIKTEKHALNAFYYAYVRYHILQTILKFKDKIQPKGRFPKAQEVLQRKEEFPKAIIHHFKRVNLWSITNASKKDIREMLLSENELVREMFVAYFEEYNENLKKNTSQNKKTPVETVRDRLGIIMEIPFFQNLSFLNPSKNKRGHESEVLQSFELIIYEGKVKTKGTQDVLDKTISKFMFAEEEFPNEPYGKLPRLKDLRKLVSIPQVFLLSFPIPFVTVRYRGYQTNVLFYAPELKVSYNIMKRLKVKIRETQNDLTNIFKLTWESVIDELLESKAKFSLENMYIIEYGGIDRQSLVNVEYIGIPKLHASIILDDQIRDAINTSLSVGDSNVWLLGEFIKQKPLYPLISKHLWNAVRKNSSPKWRASLYALAIDAKLKSEGNPALFGRAFFDRPKRAAVEVKDFHRDMNSVAVTIKELSPEIGGRNLIHTLFSSLRRHNRNAFVNTLLKALLQSKSKDKVGLVNSYLFRRILNNDSSWEDFALALVIGLVGGCGDVSSGQDIVED